MRSGTPWTCLSLCLLVLAAGCNKRPTSTKHYEVTGKVLFKGKPLPGGRITFTAANGGFANTSNIDQDGQYKIAAPVGDVNISVDNTMLRQARDAPHGPIASPGMIEHSGGELIQVRGTYVRIPDRFKDPDTSGLTYTVKPEAQSYDVTLQ